MTKPLSIKNFFQRSYHVANLADYEDKVSGGEINLHVTQFNFLYQDCFGDHLIAEPCHDSANLHAELGDSKRIIDTDNIDTYFLRNSMVTPIITQTANSDPKDKEEKKIQFGEFVKYITDPPLRAEISNESSLIGENRVSYLLGDPGMGKTLTILKLLDVIRGMKNDYRGYQVIPIYIDLHEGDCKPSHPFHSIGHASFRHLTQKIIKKASELKIPGLSKFAGDVDDLRVDANIKDLAMHIAKHKYFILFIFDNADRFYFEESKYSFFGLYAKKRDLYIEKNLLFLTDKFVSEAELGKIGASVLFVCRKYVYSHLRWLNDPALRSRAQHEGHSLYQVIPISGKEAIDSRLKLMEAAIEAIQKRYRQQGGKYTQLLNELQSLVGNMSTHGNEQTLNTILHLSHQGLRTFLGFLSQIEIDFRPNYQIIDRLFEKPHNLLRLYLTNLRKRFSQKIGHFPNIFLVDGLVDKRPGFEDAHKPHRHTYWLKYFLLKYTHTKQQVSADNLISFFCDELGYENEIVRLAIGSLVDPSAGRCFDIVPRQQAAPDVQFLKISSRGKVLVGGLPPNFEEDPLCFEFDYLQLVTDDIWLSLPKPWSEKIYVNASIAHTLKEQLYYNAKARDTIKIKIPAVLYFLRVLQASLFWECKLHGELLLLENKSLIPDFSKIEESLFESMQRVVSAAFHDQSFRGKEILEEAVSLWDKIKKDEAFDEFFFWYGESGLLISEDM